MSSTNAFTIYVLPFVRGMFKHDHHEYAMPACLLCHLLIQQTLILVFRALEILYALINSVEQCLRQQCDGRDCDVPMRLIHY